MRKVSKWINKYRNTFTIHKVETVHMGIMNFAKVVSGGGGGVDSMEKGAFEGSLGDSVS